MSQNSKPGTTSSKRCHRRSRSDGVTSLAAFSDARSKLTSQPAQTASSQTGGSMTSCTKSREYLYDLDSGSKILRNKTTRHYHVDMGGDCALKTAPVNTCSTRDSKRSNCIPLPTHRNQRQADKSAVMAKMSTRNRSFDCIDDFSTKSSHAQTSEFPVSHGKLWGCIETRRDDKRRPAVLTKTQSFDNNECYSYIQPRSTGVGQMMKSRELHQTKLIDPHHSPAWDACSSRDGSCFEQQILAREKPLRTRNNPCINLTSQSPNPQTKSVLSKSPRDLVVGPTVRSTGADEYCGVYEKQLDEMLEKCASGNDGVANADVDDDGGDVNERVYSYHDDDDQDDIPLGMEACHARGWPVVPPLAKVREIQPIKPSVAYQMGVRKKTHRKPHGSDGHFTSSADSISDDGDDEMSDGDDDDDCEHNSGFFVKSPMPPRNIPESIKKKKMNYSWRTVVDP